MLPDIDGFEVCRRLRGAGRWHPVLVLTARDAIHDRVAGLDAGADDYLTKPFSFAELNARLRALIRRGGGERPTVLEVGDLTLDPATRRVWRGASDVELTNKEFVLLEYFMRHPGEVLSRTRLIEHVWDFNYDGGSNVVDVYVRYLRSKVDRPFRKRSIETVRAPAIAYAPRTRPVPVRTRLTLVFAVLMALVIAGSAVFIYLRLRDTLRDTVDDGLRSRAQVLLAALDDSRINLGEGVQLIDPGDAFAQIVGPDGTVLDSSPGLQDPLIPSSELAGLTRPRYLEETVHGPEASLPARLYAIPAAQGSVVVVGASLDDTHDTLTALVRSIWVGAPVALALTTAIVWLLAEAALRLVEHMRAEAEALSAGETGRLLHVPPTRDEVARLGETLNRLLARLEEALDRERRVVDDASHELRTPLAILRAELDLALGRAHSGGAGSGTAKCRRRVGTTLTARRAPARSCPLRSRETIGHARAGGTLRTRVRGD